MRAAYHTDTRLNVQSDFQNADEEQESMQAGYQEEPLANGAATTSEGIGKELSPQQDSSEASLQDNLGSNLGTDSTTEESQVELYSRMSRMALSPQESFLISIWVRIHFRETLQVEG